MSTFLKKKGKKVLFLADSMLKIDINGIIDNNRCIDLKIERKDG